MRKTTILFKKTDGMLRPAYQNQFQAIQDLTPEGKWIKGEFSDIEKAKSKRQLGFLYAKAKEDGRSGIYEFVTALFLERDGHLYEVEKFGYTVIQKANIENVDIMLKMFFCIHKGIKEFNKREASMELMSEYINFIDIFCIQNFGYPIPEAIKQQDQRR